MNASTARSLTSQVCLSGANSSGYTTPRAPSSMLARSKVDGSDSTARARMLTASTGREKTPYQSSTTSNSRRPPCASPSPRCLRGSSQYQHRRKPANQGKTRLAPSATPPKSIQVPQRPLANCNTPESRPHRASESPPAPWQKQPTADRPQTLTHARKYSALGTQSQGEPHGEFTSYFTLDEDSADSVFHTNLDPEIHAAVQEAGGDPKTLHEARSRSDWPCWKEAMDREMDTLEKALTWEIVLRRPGKWQLGSKWAFRTKRNADGSIDRYKARLVAKGFTQIHGVDYFDTSSLVAKLSSFRTILANAARFDWEVESFDFNGAYPNGEVDEDEEIYICRSPWSTRQEAAAALSRYCGNPSTALKA